MKKILSYVFLVAMGVFLSLARQASAADLNCACTCDGQDEAGAVPLITMSINEDILSALLSTVGTGSYSPPVIDPPIDTEPTSSPEESADEALPITEPLIPQGVIKVLISEFVADPITGDKEWVELYNASSQAVDLVGWQLVEGSGQKTALSGMIGVGEYKVFDKASLNNSGDLIVLQNVAGQIVDQVAYGDWNDGNVADNAPAATDPYSVIRQSLSLDLDVDNLDFVVTKVVTSGAQNIYASLVLPPVVEPVIEEQEPVIAELVEPVVDEDDLTEILVDLSEPMPEPMTIRVNEILPNPAGADTGAEWIELYNFGEEPINLLGWSLDDEDGGSFPYKISESLIIPAKAYRIFSNEQTKLVLNNTADQARLFDASKNLISQIAYEEVFEAQSYAYFETGWQWTKELTPQAENVLTLTQADNSGGLIKVASAAGLPSSTATAKTASSATTVVETTLAKVRALPLGTMVKVVGQVSVAPGIFNSQIIYLQGSGLQIYNSKAKWPDLKEGYILEVTGKISESLGERRLVTNFDSLKVLVSDQVDLQPTTINSEEVGENIEGWLVQLSGDLVKKESSRLTFADEFGEYLVLLKEGSGVSSKIFKVGEKYQVTGIVSQNNEEYRIMPRAGSDIVNLTLVATSPAGETALSQTVAVDEGKSQAVKSLMIILGVLAFGLIIGGWFYREKIMSFFIKLKLKFSKPVAFDFGERLSSQPKREMKKA